MRTIKFRYFRNGEMNYNPDLILNDFVDLNEQIEELEENGVLMEYTGLKDRDDKEIYEGDVLRMVVGDIISYHLMEFKKGRFTCFEDSISDSQFEYLEVVGNIYENPDLNEKL